MLKGIDISKWQGVGTGDQAADFVICKATEGAGYVDSVCDQHYQRAKSQGKLLGVYHFARPDLNGPEAEAEWFVKNIQGYIGEALLALDYEVAPYSDDWAHRFCAKVHEMTGVWPVVYMSASKVTEYNWSRTAKECGLWIAGYPNAYNVDNPPTPGVNDMPYSTGAWATWAIWQYSSSNGKLDRDIANMGKTAWKKYAKPNSEPAPTPTPTPTPAKKTNEEIADEVLAGKWGNGDDRKKRLEAAGYDYNAIQEIVNRKAGVKKSNEEIANEVMAGKWGNGDDRKNRLEAAGYNYDAIQAIVNNKMTPAISYAVRRGDTLSAIAQRYGTTVDKIVQDNPFITNPDVIYPGQRLVIRK